jgi:hypothetical protein
MSGNMPPTGNIVANAANFPRNVGCASGLVTPQLPRTPGIKLRPGVGVPSGPSWTILGPCLMFGFRPDIRDDSCTEVLGHRIRSAPIENHGSDVGDVRGAFDTATCKEAGGAAGAMGFEWC